MMIFNFSLLYAHQPFIAIGIPMINSKLSIYRGRIQHDFEHNTNEKYLKSDSDDKLRKDKP